MSVTSILFVVNPISGGIDKRDLDKAIADFCHENKLNHSILKTTGTNDPQSIKKALDQINPSITVACGGDGTVTMVAHELIGRDVKLAIMPLGSANGMAYEFGIPEESAECLSLLIRPRITQIDAIRVNDKHLSLHLSDIGFNAKLIKEFERKGMRGKVGYAKSFLKIFIRRKAGRYQVILEGKTVRHKAEMIVIANASSYGTGAVVNPRCDMSDGLFEVCVFKPLPWYKFLALTWQSFIGQIEKSPYYTLYQTDQVTIKANRNEEVQVDGEVVGKMKTVTAKIIKNALTVIVPGREIF